MIYTIENEYVKVDILDLGAEIQSIYGKKNKFEYLWQGNPEYWKGRATVLFPICGRLTEGKYTYKGKEYEMILHGFCKKRVYDVVNIKSNEITFEIKSNEETKLIYPFDFIFRVRYILNKSTVRTEFNVVNIGKEILPFSLGGHPGFNLPMDEGLNFGDYYLEFDNKRKVEQLINSETCYYTGKNKPIKLIDDKILKLNHSLFDNDAIFLANMDNTVTLKSDKGKKFVKIHYEDMTHLGLWHAPKTTAPYVCLEPWHGTPAYDGIIDDFSTKNEFMYLPTGKEYSTFFDITVSE